VGLLLLLAAVALRDVVVVFEDEARDIFNELDDVDES
jgi:hypothetical protein